MLTAAARAVNAAFFLVTGFYCLLTYNAFAYQQFIKPHLVSWLSEFTAWHHLWFWLMVGMTALTVLRDRAKPRDAWIGWSYLAFSAVLGTVLVIRPVLPQVENNARGLALAFAALVPPVWLAVLDHRVTPAPDASRPSPSGQMAWGLLTAAAFVWAHQTASLPWRVSNTGEITMTTMSLLFGALTSAAVHLAVFGFLAVLFIAATRVAWLAGGARSEYWAVVLLSAAAVSTALQVMVFGSISFRGAAAWGLSVALGLTVALVWSGVARRLHGVRAQPGCTAIEAWLAPVPGSSSPGRSWVGLALLAAASYVILFRLATFDWDFLMQRVFVLTTWVWAFGYGFGVVSRTAGSGIWRPALVASAIGAVLGGGRVLVQASAERSDAKPPFVAEFALEGYSAIDTSYRVIADGLRVRSAADAVFYDYLRANSSIQHVNLSPVSVDFARPLHASARRKPHIFLFVVDSLRPDYLSPYNPSVTFTPNIGRFAAESDVFERAFTRYGGTALSVPAIWAGGMLIHKIYVRPFDPMNTLLKLLHGENYRLFMSMDPIVNELIARGPTLTELDRGVPIVEYGLCRTLDELQQQLTGTIEDPRPVFAYSLPQNMHISHVREKPVPPGAAYPGFVAPVAAELQRVDACFGDFIAFLQARGLYDDSLIVLTSDHGDSLGESLRWGHAYTLFPEVVRIPLIVRVPEWLRGDRTADPGSLAFSTDLSPTLHDLLGHSVADLGPLFGAPLLTAPGTGRPGRRTDGFLIASSYGPVYGVLRDNGTRLYIADGINSRDYAYDLAGPSPLRVGVTPSDREVNRRLIRDQVDELARIYGFRAAGS